MSRDDQSTPNTRRHQGDEARSERAAIGQLGSITLVPSELDEVLRLVTQGTFSGDFGAVVFPSEKINSFLTVPARRKKFLATAEFFVVTVPLQREVGLKPLDPRSPWLRADLSEIDQERYLQARCAGFAWRYRHVPTR